MSGTFPNSVSWSVRTICAAAAFLSLFASESRAAEPAGESPRVASPLSPADSLKHFQLAPGLKIELVAAEPEVIDPVSIAFDEFGTLWAVEMTDYPNGPKAGQPPLSRIRALKDLDGDGRYETSRVFADKLLFATGVQPWKGGVIVTLAGEVAWFHDSDGDGTADVRQTWFKGFAEGNPQLRANHPRWGLDNRIYIANGLRGGVITADAKAWGREQPPVSINGFDFRFDPLTGTAESISGAGQFGLTFDDFGHRFVCSNRNPCRQILLEDYYLKRNPLLAVKDVGSDAVPSGAESRVYPLSRAWTTSTTHAGQFTAACGVTIYRGTALPTEFYGNSFTCEPTGNLVHREILRRKGAEFGSEPSTATAEFLATADEWFRPVDMANGPDGALYVVDMYRAVIEHPEWVPDELKNRPDERDGSDRGRIYRIVSRDAAQLKKPVIFTPETTTAALVEMLAFPDSWPAETAARVLSQRQSSETHGLLVKLSRASKSDLGRLRAYRLLGSFGANADDAIQAMRDTSAGVREQGLLLQEGQFASNPALVQQALQLADDPDPRVRFQLALSLSTVSNQPAAMSALARILVRDAGDEWIRRAVLISGGQTPADFLQAWVKLLKADKPPSTGTVASLLEIANLVGAQQDSGTLTKALKTVLELPNHRLKSAGFLGLCQGIQRRGKAPQSVLPEILASEPELAGLLTQLFQLSLARANDGSSDIADRLDSLSVLQFSNWMTVGDSLLKLIATDESQEICVKGIEILGGFDDPQLADRLLENYSVRTPVVRRAIIRALLRNPQRIQVLFQAIQAKQISPVELDPAQVRGLTSHADPELKKRALDVLASAVPQDRKQVLEQYQAALKLAAKPERGRQVFEKNCAACHQIGKLGVVVGPDIADLRTKTPAQVLLDILSPNQAIDNNYVSYTVVTKDGRVETGFIAAETASSITLKQPENKTQLILRQDIEELKSNGISLMPEGLEKNISIEQMADLISFVKNWRYLSGQVPIKVSQP